MGEVHEVPGVRAARSRAGKRIAPLNLVVAGAHHVAAIELTDEMEHCYGTWGWPNPRALLKHLCEPSPTSFGWAAVSTTPLSSHVYVYGLMGAGLIHSGCARGWYCPDARVVRDKRELLRFFGAFELALDSIFSQWSLHRVEAVIMTRYEHFIAPLKSKRAGFECEGVMKRYDPEGNDYYLFAKTLKKGDG